MAGGEGDQVVAEGLERPHRLAVHLPVREHRGEIVARVLAAVLDDAREELVQLDAELADRLLARLARALELLVLVREELVGEPQDARLLLARHAEDGGEDAQRVRGGDVAREVALALAALARERVDELARARPARPRRCDSCARGVNQDEATLRKLRCSGGSISMMVRIAPTPSLRSMIWLRARVDDARLAQELVGLLRDLADVRVARDRPERRVARAARSGAPESAGAAPSRTACGGPFAA